MNADHRYRNNARRFVTVTFACLAIILLALFRVIWQGHINHILVRALRQNDSRTALTALSEGADANACEEPEESFWQRVRRLLGKHGGSDANHVAPPSALLVTIDWRWHDVYKQSHFFVDDTYAPANAPMQDPEVIRQLLEHGAAVEVQNEIGLRPLQIAAWEGKASTVRLLLEHGAQIDCYAGSGNWSGTALMFAISAEDLPTINTLLEHGADTTHIRDVNGDTALSLATGRENKAVARVVVQYSKRSLTEARKPAKSPGHPIHQ